MNSVVFLEGLASFLMFFLLLFGLLFLMSFCFILLCSLPYFCLNIMVSVFVCVCVYMSLLLFHFFLFVLHIMLCFFFKCIFFKRKRKKAWSWICGKVVRIWGRRGKANHDQNVSFSKLFSIKIRAGDTKGNYD